MRRKIGSRNSEFCSIIESIMECVRYMFRKGGDTIKKMLKECWNEKLAPNEFEERVFKSSLSAEEQNQIIDDLFTFCGSDEEPSLLFLQYLNIIFINAPQQVAQYYKDPSGTHCSAVLRMILGCGNSFFDSFSITEEYSVNFAVQVLIIIIENDSIDALKIVSESSQFDVLIAKAKYLFPELIQNICADFPKQKFLECFGPTLPYPRSLLCEALYLKDVTKPFLFSNHEMTRAIIPNISMFDSIPTIFTFINAETFHRLYMHIVSDFLLSPSLLHGYLITNLFPRMEEALHSGDIHMELASVFNKESVINMLDKCKGNVEKKNVLTEHSEREASDYLFTIEQVEELKNLFTYLPPNIDNNMLIEECLLHPALTSTLPSKIMEAIQFNNFHLLRLYSEQVLTRHVDFLTLLLQQNQYFIFISNLVNAIYLITDDADFSPCWILLLTLIRELWAVGSQKYNSEILAFIQVQENDGLRNFLLTLVNQQAELTLGLNNDQSPFAEAIRFFQELTNATISLEQASQRIVKKPFLAPVLLTYCVTNPSPEMQNIWENKLEPYHINNLYFYHLMIKVSKQPKPWIAASEMPDYEFLLGESPIDISELNFLLAHCFDMLMQSIPMSPSVLWDLVCCWKAWSQVFGVSIFVKQLFEQLIWKASHVSYLADVDLLFQSAAYIMLILCNQDSTMINDILQNVDQFIDGSIEENIYAEAMAHFVLILVCSTTGGWEASFDLILSKCITFINEESANQQKIKFAISIFKTSIGNKLLSTRLGEEVEKALQKLREWTVLTEYYSMKAASLSQTE